MRQQGPSSPQNQPPRLNWVLQHAFFECLLSDTGCMTNGPLRGAGSGECTHSPVPLQDMPGLRESACQLGPGFEQTATPLRGMYHVPVDEVSTQPSHRLAPPSCLSPCTTGGAQRAQRGQTPHTAGSQQPTPTRPYLPVPLQAWSLLLSTATHSAGLLNGRTPATPLVVLRQDVHAALVPADIDFGMHAADNWSLGTCNMLLLMF
jgi:hypothetical protein